MKEGDYARRHCAKTQRYWVVKCIYEPKSRTNNCHDPDCCTIVFVHIASRCFVDDDAPNGREMSGIFMQRLRDMKRSIMALRCGVKVSAPQIGVRAAYGGTNAYLWGGMLFAIHTSDRL